MLKHLTLSAPLSESEVTPVGLRVISAMKLGEDALKRCGIERGMRVFDLECGTGDASLAIAKVVGPTGLVVGIDTSAEAIDVAEKRATLAGQCYWTRFVTADLNTFVPPERFNAVVVRLTGLHQAGRASFSRLSAYVRPYGVIVIASDKSAELNGLSDMDGSLEIK
ncbi:cyclopropane fatty-acyl-phospholipid synthase-like methyltransferase [Nitrobacteraceae bacterium AZCC 1564]